MFDCFPATVHSLIRANCCNLARLGDVTLFILIIPHEGGSFHIVQPFIDSDFDIIRFCFNFSRATRKVLAVSVCQDCRKAEPQVGWRVPDAYWPGTGFAFVQFQRRHPEGPGERVKYSTSLEERKVHQATDNSQCPAEMRLAQNDIHTHDPKITFQCP